MLEIFFGLRLAKNKRKWRYPNWMGLLHPLGIPYYGLWLGSFVKVDDEEERRALEEEVKALEVRLSLIKKRLEILKQQGDDNGDSLDYIAWRLEGTSAWRLVLFPDWDNSQFHRQSL